jgi:ABC-type glutathione transport system ATPase component
VSAAHLLEVVDLSVELSTRSGSVRALDGLSFTLDRAHALAIVGPSGSGKSTLAMAILGLLDLRSSRILGGRIVFEARDLIGMDPKVRRTLLGARMAIVFQETLLSLDPLRTVGAQMIEARRAHHAETKDQARRAAMSALERARLPDAEAVLDLHPHQLSGGMRQRAMIALALLSSPSLLVLDEATSALDPQLADQIVDLVLELKRAQELTLVVITHDLRVADRLADEIAVIDRGRIIEQGAKEVILAAPKEPLTKKLVALR